MTTIYERPGWQRWAACRGDMVDGRTDWFPPNGGFDAAGRAKLICYTCPVRRECSEAGLREDHGIWAGTTPRRRRVIRVGTAPEQVTCADCGAQFERSDIRRKFCARCSTTSAQNRRHNERVIRSRGGRAYPGLPSIHSSRQAPNQIRPPEPLPDDLHDRRRWAAADALDDPISARKPHGGAA